MSLVRARERTSPLRGGIFLRLDPVYLATRRFNVQTMPEDRFTLPTAVFTSGAVYLDAFFFFYGTRARQSANRRGLRDSSTADNSFARVTIIIYNVGSTGRDAWPS